MRKIYMIAGMWVALLSAQAQQTATFEDLELQVDSFYNGSDGAGGFISGGIWFPNSYNAVWGNWSGFAVSNMKDTITPGYLNQYSAITGGGADSSQNYALAYYQGELSIGFDDPVKAEGFYVTNTVYTYLSMQNGDDWTKKFGGADGSDPDYLLLKVYGADTTGNVTDSVQFYLADFRFEKTEDDYIVNTWEWLDLTSLGEVSGLKFHMESTDMGDWGMNTPAYFCIDNFTVTGITSQTVKMPYDKPDLNVYPNPVKDVFRVEIPDDAETLFLTDATGRILFSDKVSEDKIISISALSGKPSGIYYLKVNSKKNTFSKIILKH
jgi:hypothetical protein